ncbi:MAG: hypothetical protein M0Z77_10360 [Thermoplasmatales archaeon]|jgi:hypothetical protein|nr:hypothetical protein [Candidatus Thermoplasmatota archaeon]MCL6003353.1 hypothetical protein [Candidatus Thermoplasmatota archaeon]MDA8056029.1 hypothetical protein [Thermoplasmatales archaeon]
MKVEKDFDATKTVKLKVISSKLDDTTRILGGILKGVDHEVVSDFNVEYVKKGENSIDIQILISYFQFQKTLIVQFLDTLKYTAPGFIDYEGLYKGLERRDRKMVALALIPYFRAIRSLLRGGNKKVVIEDFSVDKDKIPKKLRDDLVEKDEDEWFQFGE